MSFTEQRMSTEQEAWLSLSRGFKESAIMDWIMSNTKRFCEMVAEQKDFPFVLIPKVSDTGKNVESEKCSPGQAPVLDKVCSDRDHKFVIVNGCTFKKPVTL